jgi:hypothetical protein
MMRMGPPEELDMFIYVPYLFGMAEVFEMPWLGFLHVLVVPIFHCGSVRIYYLFLEKMHFTFED